MILEFRLKTHPSKKYLLLFYYLKFLLCKCTSLESGFCYNAVQYTAEMDVTLGCLAHDYVN